MFFQHISNHPDQLQLLALCLQLPTETFLFLTHGHQHVCKMAIERGRVGGCDCQKANVGVDAFFFSSFFSSSRADSSELRSSDCVRQQDEWKKLIKSAQNLVGVTVVSFGLLDVLVKH